MFVIILFCQQVISSLTLSLLDIFLPSIPTALRHYTRAELSSIFLQCKKTINLSFSLFSLLHLHANNFYSARKVSKGRP